MGSSHQKVWVAQMRRVFVIGRHRRGLDRGFKRLTVPASGSISDEAGVVLEMPGRLRHHHVGGLELHDWWSRSTSYRAISACAKVALSSISQTPRHHMARTTGPFRQLLLCRTTCRSSFFGCWGGGGAVFGRLLSTVISTSRGDFRPVRIRTYAHRRHRCRDRGIGGNGWAWMMV